MSLPTESQWARYSALCARLQAVPAAERGAVLQALRAEGHDDPQVLSLVALHWALPPDPARDRTGDRLGDFTLEEPLGAGGMGVVYRAQQHIGAATRPVAVKLIHPTLLRTAREEALARFQTEINTLVKLEHEGIARIYGGGITEDPHTHERLPYLAMELVRGGLPITTYAREYAVPWPECLALFLRVCRAVQYAHEHRVIHRDLKPANILVDRDGGPFVIDFGLARAFDALLPGAHRAASGTPAYMSPEQVSEAFGPMSAKSDVYALGLILYELLTGQHPYALPPDGTFTQWCRTIAEVPMPPLHQYSEAYGGELEEILAAALAKRPADRLRVDVLRARLERYLQKLPPEIDWPAPDPRELPRDFPTVSRRNYLAFAPVTARPPGAADLPTAPALDQAHAAAPLAPGPPASPPSRPQTPLSYTPGHLADKILTLRSALEGERKQVTVLCANLHGAAEVLADRDPEEAQRLLDPFLDRIMEAVHRYEGTVNHISGDGVMALFGAPLAYEDHAARACHAALAMQKAILQGTEELRRETGIELQLRAGLNSGEVVVRAIGHDLHMEYAAVGHTTYLAAQLERCVPPGAICLTGETLRAVEGVVRVKPLDPVQIAGLRGPAEVYELIGTEPTRTRLPAATARVLTPFVGRQYEIETLRQALEWARTGHGQVVAVIGEPGVGKSRLFLEFTQPDHTKGWLILEAGAVSSYGKATPYLPIIDLLKAYFQVEGPDDGREMREKITDKLLALDEALKATLPAFFTLLDLPVEDPQWQALDPPQRRRRVLDAVKRVLLRESQVQPLLVIVENLHWIDTETQAVLDSLVESLPTARLLLLVNYRPDYQHSWGNKSYYTQLRLDPLPPARAEEMLQTLLGRDASLQPLKERLIERTEGNPFFLEESVWTLAETKALVGERGAYRLAQALPTIQVPATVQAVLAARIDRLPPEAKQLLQTAAVIGREVLWPLLEAIVEVPARDLEPSLAHLQRAEFLYEMPLGPERTYTFKHVLTQEVAYGSLPQERRRALHARLVTHIEAGDADRLASQVERLAHHAVRGKLWEQALVYCQQAGLKAATRSAHREAVGYFEQALAVLPHLPEERATQEQAIELRFSLRNALLPLGAHAQIVDHLRAAQTLAEVLHDERRLGRAHAYLAEYYRLTGDAARAVESGERALALATALGDFALEVMATHFVGTVHCALGDYRRAVDCFRRNVASLTGELIHERFGMTGLPAVMSRAWAVSCLDDLGAFDEGAARGEEAVRLAEALDHPFSLIQACIALGSLYLRKGDVPQAIPVLERGLERCQDANILTWLPTVAATLGYAYTLAGRVAEALPLLQQAAAQDTSRGVSSAHARRVTYLSEAYLLSGHRDEAMGLARSALALARDLKARGIEAYALRLLGESHAQQEPLAVEAADAAYRQALALADELGMRPLLAHCYLGLGTLYTKVGQRAQARAALSTAIELFQAMGMMFWLPRAETMLAHTA